MCYVMRASVLAVLFSAACAGYVAWGYDDHYDWYYPCDPHDHYCDDYYWYVWAPGSLAADEFDGDGLLDLAVADGLAGTIWYVKGQPGGGFDSPPVESVSLPGAPAQLAPVTANGDSALDLVVLDRRPGTLATYAGDGRGGFHRVSATALKSDGAAAVAAPGVVRFVRGALDADAFDDLVFLTEDGSLHAALGTGAGTFVEVAQDDLAATFLGPDAVSRLAGVHLAVGDFDEDPGADLAVVDGDRATLATFSGHEDGTFGPPRTTAFPAPGDVLDVAPLWRGPGRTDDLAVLTGSRTDLRADSSVAVVEPDDGLFGVEPLLVGMVRSIFATDLDGDGLTDLLLLDSVNGTIGSIYARTIE